MLTGEAAFEKTMDRFLDDLGLEQLPETVKTEFKQKLSEELFRRISATLLSRLPSEKQDYLKDILEKSADQVTIKAFITENIPDLEDFIEAETKTFKREFVCLFFQAVKDDASFGDEN